MEIVFKMATAPGEGTFEISLKPIEWQLLLLVDATRSVSELASDTGRTDFEVARILYGLFCAGLLEFASDEEVERNRAERAAREARLAQIEAERRAAEDAERQAALAARSRRRGRAARAKPEAAPRQTVASGIEPDAQPEAEQETRAPSAPAEVPSFLGGGQPRPTDDDEAALEEFMGAVLGHSAPAGGAEPDDGRAGSALHPCRGTGVHERRRLDTATLGLRPEVPLEDLLGISPAAAARADLYPWSPRPEPAAGAGTRAGTAAGTRAGPNPSRSPSPSPNRAGARARTEPEPEPEPSPNPNRSPRRSRRAGIEHWPSRSSSSTGDFRAGARTGAVAGRRRATMSAWTSSVICWLSGSASFPATSSTRPSGSGDGPQADIVQVAAEHARDPSRGCRRLPRRLWSGSSRSRGGRASRTSPGRRARLPRKMRSRSSPRSSSS